MDSPLRVNHLGVGGWLAERAPGCLGSGWNASGVGRPAADRQRFASGDKAAGQLDPLSAVENHELLTSGGRGEATVSVRPRY
jgi:hypothetical protein